MKKLGSIILTGLGIYVIVLAIESLFSAAFVFNQIGQESIPRSAMVVQLVSAFGTGLVIGLIGILLISFSGRLASRLFGDEPLEVNFDGPAATRTGLILIGVSFSVVALARLGLQIGNVVAQHLVQMPFDVGVRAPITVWLSNVVMLVIELALGLVLVIWSRPLSERLWSGAPARPERVAPVGAASCPACGAPYDPADYRDLSAARCANCHAPLSGDGA